MRYAQSRMTSAEIVGAIPLILQKRGMNGARGGEIRRSLG